MVINHIKPPKTICTITDEGHRVFLAGSIEMGKAEDWQQKITDTLHKDKYRPFIIYNPRRDDWDSSWKQGMEEPQFYQQVNWEMNALDKCDTIFMYFDKNTKSPISLLELGLYASSKKMVVCCPDGFWRKGNVVAVCEKYGIPMYNDFDEATESLIKKVKTSGKQLLT